MTDPNQPQHYRLRLVFSKKREVKYISHLDLSLAWERALRRARIPLAYSQGFNPRPKVQFASGLPLGTMGANEIMDIVVTEHLEPPNAQAQIEDTLPVGIGLHGVQEVPLRSPTLQQLVRQAEYRVAVESELPADKLSKSIGDLLQSSSIIQVRLRRQKQETFDLRPLLHELRLDSLVNGTAHLSMRLTAGQSGNLRPEAVLQALNLGDSWFEIERTSLIFAEKDPL